MVVWGAKIFRKVTGLEATCPDEEVADTLLDCASASRGAEASASTKDRLLCLCLWLPFISRRNGRVSFSPKTRPQSRRWRLLSSVSYNDNVFSRGCTKEVNSATMISTYFEEQQTCHKGNKENAARHQVWKSKGVSLQELNVSEYIRILLGRSSKKPSKRRTEN